MKLFSFLFRSETEKKIKSIVGFYPNDAFFYQLAFVHKSAANQSEKWNDSNERLELLGDAVLSTAVSDYLFRTYPAKKEGELSATRAKLVSRATLNEIALRMGLEKHIHSNLPLHQVNQNNSLPGNALEALIGAIYLDKGYNTAQDFVERIIFKKHANFKEFISKEVNYKSKVLEWSQKNKRSVEFILESEEGVGIEKVFHVNLVIEGTTVENGQGLSKKKAEQAAAEAWIKKLTDGQD